MTDYTEFFLASRSDVVQLDLIEVTHPHFTKPYRIVRNSRDGITVDLSAAPEDQNVFFEYYPVKMTPLGSGDDLDAAIRIDLGDLGEVLPVELDAVATAAGFLTKPKVRYWTFRSDDLTAPIFGPIRLEVGTIAFNADGASFEAKAPSLNINRTGELYRMERFPMLRGLI
jgi:hypothetical protein